MTRRLTTTLALCWLVLQPLAAQQIEASSSFTDVVDVEVINLEVYVTDSDGRAVTGLRPEEFELRADGRPVAITNFYAVEQGRRSAYSIKALDEEEASSPSLVGTADPVFLVVFFDNVHLGQFNRNRVIDQVRDFLKQRMKEGDQVMLATFDGQVHLRQRFTNDWKQVKSALAEMSADPGFGHRREREHIDTIQDILAISDLYGNIPRAELATRCPRQIGEIARTYAEQVYARVRATTGSLGTFVDTMGSLPGRKALIHVSDGIPLLPGAEVYEYLCMLCGSCASDVADPNSFDSVQAQDEIRSLADGPLAGADFYDGRSAQVDAVANDTSELFHELTRKANSHGVTFFTLEAYGPRAYGATAAGDSRTTSASIERVRISSLQDTLTNMASETGGRAILNTTDFTPAFASIGEDLDTYYSLGYSLPSSAEGRVVNVKVNLLRPGLRVRYRKSLHAKPLTEQLADRTRGALMFGLDDNPLSIAIEVGQPEPLDQSLSIVPIRLRIPLDKITLLPEGGGERGMLSLYLAARDRTGRMAPVRTAQIPINIPAGELAAAKEKPYLYEVRMLMREGDHAVSVGLHDDIGRVASYLTETVMVFPR